MKSELNLIVCFSLGVWLGNIGYHASLGNYLAGVIIGAIAAGLTAFLMLTFYGTAYALVKIRNHFDKKQF